MLPMLPLLLLLLLKPITGQLRGVLRLMLRVRLPLFSSL